jgi:tRNA-2-methylthio-N6-dimethylallyladenosine synthase
MKFTVITFGCQMNVHDSLWLARAMRARGWEEVPEDQAEVFVLNTCSVREKPEQKVYSCLGRLAPFIARGAGRFAAVGGCVAQQVGRGFFERFPFVRLVFGADGVARAPMALERLAENPGERVSLLDFLPGYEERELALPGAGGHADQETGREEGQASPFSAFVNIMQGCDNFCTYCIVPFVRGRQKSRAPGDVLAECRALAARGVREITLLGQNVNAYGLDDCGQGLSFAQLLGQVAAVDGITRLRFTTSHPKDLAPEVIAAFARHENLCPQLHLPLQAGSDAVLKKMGRRYGRERYLSLVRDLRAARPDLALTTDLIVGFPGETEADFGQTLEIMEEVRFAGAFSFKYSDRPGTAAERMAPKVDGVQAGERLVRLQNLQDRITEEYLEAQVGRTVAVLVEGPSRKQDGEGVGAMGRDPWSRVVNLPGESPSALAGCEVPVRIREARKHSLVGERVETPCAK